MVNLFLSPPVRGVYRLDESDLSVQIEAPLQSVKGFPNMRRGMVCWTLRLDQTHEGSRNLLYVESHYSLHEGDDMPLHYRLDRFCGRPFIFIADRNFRRRSTEVFPDEAGDLSWRNFYDANGKLDLKRLYQVFPHEGTLEEEIR